MTVQSKSKSSTIWLDISCQVACAAVFIVFAFLAACHSSHIEVSVENRTGAPIRLLEVDYPSASFGKDSLAAGATLHYRIQVQGSGRLKLQYTAPDGRQPQIDGPDLAELQQGTLAIVLLPAGKADFQSHLSSSR
jgi:hypothetical protein